MNNQQERNAIGSVVTPLVKQAVAGFQYAFFYLYPNIFEIDIDPNGFVFIKAVPFTRKLLPWLMSITIITGICGWGSCFLIILAQISGVQIKPWIKWSLFNTLIAFGILFVTTFQMFGCYVLYNSSFALQSVKKLLLLEQTCISSIHQTQPPTKMSKFGKPTHYPKAKDLKFLTKYLKVYTQYPKKIIGKDSIGIFLNLLIVYVITVPLPAAIVAVSTQLDPFYFVLEQFFLPHPDNRSTQMIVLVILVRLVLAFFGIAEFLRFVSFAALAVMILVFAIVSISQKLVHVFYEKCIRLYIQLKLIIATIQNLVDLFTAIAIFGNQVVTILLLWVVFKCFNLLSIYLYVIDCFLAAFVITFMLMMLPAVGSLHVDTKKLIKRKITLYHCTGPKSNSKYYYYTLWKSQQSVSFSCSGFFIIKQDVTVLYSKELINNLVNAVLLIDPKII